MRERKLAPTNIYKSPWIRLVLVVSIDGRLAFPSGGKTKLGGKGDQKILEEALAWSDCTLMGGNTLREHKSTCLIKNSLLINNRHLEGRSNQPISLIVSNHKDYCKDWLFFHQPITRWLLTNETISQQHAEEIGFTRAFYLENSWRDTFLNLTKEGLSRIVILGGAELTGTLLIADQIDELQLTISPRIIGGNNSWVPHSIDNLPENIARSDSWYLKSIESFEGDELLVRYFRNDKSKKH